MGVGTHTTIAFRCKCFQFRYQVAFCGKQFFRMIAFHPRFHHLHMLRPRHTDWHLMGTECVFYFFAVYFFRPGPAFWRTQNNHRPVVWHLKYAISRILLNCQNILICIFQRLRHSLVHSIMLAAFYKIWLPAHAFKEFSQIFIWNTSQNGWVGNFIAIQMQNRQYCPIPCRAQKFVALPCGSQRSCFCLAVTYHTSCN